MLRTCTGYLECFVPLISEPWRRLEANQWRKITRISSSAGINRILYAQRDELGPPAPKRITDGDGDA